MADDASLRPRDARALQVLHAVRIAAQGLRALPIGYWQRRIGARAFSLEMMPAVPRESQHVEARRVAGSEDLWMLVTEVMAWGLVPWASPASHARHVGAARAALRTFQRVAPRPFGAALFVTAPGDTTTRAVLHRVRPRGPAASYLAVGAISWEQLDEFFEDAADELPSPGARAAALRAARRLALLAC